MAEFQPIICELNTSDEFLTNVTIIDHHVEFDEPESAGGKDTAPTPTEMAIGSLGACVVMTIKIYLDHKKWAFRSVHCALRMSKEKIEDPERLSEEERSFVRSNRLTRITTVITIDADFDEKQLERVKTVAGKCPVHKLMEGSVLIQDEVQLA